LSVTASRNHVYLVSVFLLSSGVQGLVLA